MLKNQSVIYTFTIFVSAYLLFLVQPMAGKALLPVLGGTPSVWNTAMVFFQILLLGGYLYAHLLGKIRILKTQIMIHGALLITAFASLPMTISFSPPEDSASPLLWQIAIMFGMIGLPFFVLSTTAPLLQKWFSLSDHPDSHNPYFMYAASNIGSVLALILYPLVVERFFPLSNQTYIFQDGFAVLAVLIMLCGYRLRDKVQIVEAIEDTSPSPSLKTIGLWLLLAFVPSSLMLGFTTFVTTDIGSAPLFWVIPLTLYILSFVLAFARRKILSLPVIKTCFVILFLLTNVILNIFLVNYKWEVAIAHGVLFFVTALMCHQQLESLKPSTRHLTLFFLIMSVGGALGGVFNALIAPLIFLKPYEYMLVGAISLLCWGIGQHRKFLIPVMMVVMALNPVIPWEEEGNRLIHISRNYFGTLTVRDDDVVKMLAHGTTAHGSQSDLPRYKKIPLNYFSPETGIGQSFAIVKKYENNILVGGLGMGAGSISCLLRASDSLTFFEIDPDIIRIAKDTSLFTYLEDCPPAVDIVQGDARLKLKDIADRHYNLLLVDVFSGDNIPMHLLTQEAVNLYLQKTKEDGMVVIHLSNRYMELVREVGLIAAALNIPAYHKIVNSGPIADTELFHSATNVVVLTKNPSYMRDLTDSDWKLLDMKDSKLHPWTDTYANPIRALMAK